MTQIIIPQSAKPARKITLRDLKHHYPLDRLADDSHDFTDRMGGVSLTPVGTPLAARGQVGGSANSISGNSYAHLKVPAADASDFKLFNRDFTVCGWFMSGSIARLAGICGVWDAQAAEAEWVLLTRLSKLSAGVSYDGVAASELFWTATTLSSNVWYFFSFTKQGDTLRLGLNASDFISLTVSSPINDGGADFRTQRYTDEFGNEKVIIGGIDELSVYHRTLTDAELAVIYNDGVGVTVNRQYPAYEASSPDIDTHQSINVNDAEDVAWCVDSTKITRRLPNSSWAIDVSNTSPFAGLTGEAATLNHLVDCDHDGTTLWVGATYFTTNPATALKDHILGFNPTTLARTTVYDMRTERAAHSIDADCATFCILPKTGGGNEFWTIEYYTPDRLSIFDVADGSWSRDIMLTGPVMDRVQGLALHDNGWIYALDTYGNLYRLNQSGVTQFVHKIVRPNIGGEWESICFVGSRMYVIYVGASKVAQWYQLQEPL